ncbi:hypothetical protein Baya_14414 [Bagarius yarrelli]|uniref:Uncharacterized protein n=1 Tax=Bagarius yarrelli TaxID=175774 RepID=A0A556V8K3_BAGYA|nr:hypothetical protein Baya_14414 [Bagarius yarrelli]
MHPCMADPPAGDTRAAQAGVGVGGGAALNASTHLWETAILQKEAGSQPSFPSFQFYGLRTNQLSDEGDGELGRRGGLEAADLSLPHTESRIGTPSASCCSLPGGWHAPQRPPPAIHMSLACCQICVSALPLTASCHGELIFPCQHSHKPTRSVATTPVNLRGRVRLRKPRAPTYQ